MKHVIEGVRRVATQFVPHNHTLLAQRARGQSPSALVIAHDPQGGRFEPLEGEPTPHATPWPRPSKQEVRA